MRTVSKLLLTCSTALLLSACSGLKPFPTKTLWELDVKSQVCGQYEITDEVAMTFRHVRDVPLAQCPSIFGFEDKDTAPVLDWIRAARDYVRNHCK